MQNPTHDRILNIWIKISTNRIVTLSYHLHRSFNILFLVDIMEVETSFLAQQPQNFASIFLETCFPMLLLLFFFNS